MNQGDVINIASTAMITILKVSSPMLGVALLVGLTVSIFQATTQIQEATLSFVPKVVAILVSIIVFGPWMLNSLIEFTERLLFSINSYI